MLPENPFQKWMTRVCCSIEDADGKKINIRNPSSNLAFWIMFLLFFFLIVCYNFHVPPHILVFWVLSVGSRTYHCGVRPDEESTKPPAATSGSHCKDLHSPDAWTCNFTTENNPDQAVKVELGLLKREFNLFNQRKKHLGKVPKWASQEHHI